MRRFELVTPVSLDDCLSALKGRGPEVKVLAGGTDLIAQLKVGMLKVAAVVASSVRRVVVRLPRAFPLAAAFTAIARHLGAT